MHLNEMLEEIQALLDEDDDAEVLPETDDAPVRGVSTLHARPESCWTSTPERERSPNAESWEDLQSRLRVRSETDIVLTIADSCSSFPRAEYRFTFSPNGVNGQWMMITREGMPVCVYQGYNTGNIIERQFALTPDGPWFSTPYEDVHYFRDRMTNGTWSKVSPLSAHGKARICEELRRNA